MDRELNNRNHNDVTDSNPLHQHHHPNPYQQHPFDSSMEADDADADARTAIASNSSSIDPHYQTTSGFVGQRPPEAPAVVARSSPIAIQPQQQQNQQYNPNFQPALSDRNGGGIMEGYATSDDEFDDDDNERYGLDDDNNNSNSRNYQTSTTSGRVIDVEGDARKLRRKYGSSHNVVVVQTYQDESYLTSTVNNTNGNYSRDQPLLKAPYLGSLSRSANHVLSLPPISLTGMGTTSTNGNSGGDTDHQIHEPPETLSSDVPIKTAYGSLRDSHEQGRFLDGPSSYREPTSGRIRQLDHRVRYHGRTPPQISIGERMQQARRMKEIRQKELADATIGTAVPSDTSQSSTPQLPRASGATTPSSLSAMMDEASRTDSYPTSTAMLSAVNQIPSVPATGWDRSHETQQLEEDAGRGHIGNNLPQMMLSTSLTAFEVLKSSNTRTPGRNNIYLATGGPSTSILSSSGIVTSTELNSVPSGANRGHTATGGTVGQPRVSFVADTAAAAVTATPTYNTMDSTTFQNTQPTGGSTGLHSEEQRPSGMTQDRFQPLSRSLSDPTPRSHQYHFSLRERTALLASPTYGPAASASSGGTATNPASPLVQFSLPPQQQQQPHAYPLNQYNTAGAATVTAGGTIMSSIDDDDAVLHNDIERQTSETEGAFGDMDLE